MILLSNPFRNDPPPGNHENFFLEIQILTINIVNSKSLKKICCQLLSTMNHLNNIDKICSFTPKIRNEPDTSGRNAAPLPLLVPFDDTSYTIREMLHKYWFYIENDAALSEIFPSPSILAIERRKNVRDCLIPEKISV